MHGTEGASDVAVALTRTPSAAIDDGSSGRWSVDAREAEHTSVSEVDATGTHGTRRGGCVVALPQTQQCQVGLRGLPRTDDDRFLRVHYGASGPPVL